MLEYNQLMTELRIMLRKGRLDNKVSFTELAKISNISRGMLIKYENDPNADIPLTKLLHIMQVLSIPKADFLHLLKIYF